MKTDKQANNKIKQQIDKVEKKEVITVTGCKCSWLWHCMVYGICTYYCPCYRKYITPLEPKIN